MKRAVRLLLVLAALGTIGFVTAQFGDASDPRNTAVSGKRSFEQLFHPPAEVMTILRRSCFDCHSHETRWPWYSHLPFIGAELEKHVTNGRREMNLSDWNTKFDADAQAELVRGMCETVTLGMMPMKPYLMLHPQAGVSQEEAKRLCEWTERAASNLE